MLKVLHFLLFSILVVAFFQISKILPFEEVKAACNGGGCCEVQKVLVNGGRGSGYIVQDSCSEGYKSNPNYNSDPPQCSCVTNSISSTLAAPTNLVATAADNQSLNISWDVTNNAESYQLYYIPKDQLSSGSFQRVDAVGTSTVITGLQSDQIYLIHLNACDSTSCSDPSQAVSVKTALGQSSSASSEAGTCSIKKVLVNGGHGNNREIQNSCSTGFKPNPLLGRDTDACECIQEEAAACKPPTSCTSNEECTSGSGCGDYVCLGYIKGRTPGTCQSNSVTCPKAALTCSTDLECQPEGLAGCAEFHCWGTEGKEKSCRLGNAPASTKLCSPTDKNCSKAGGVVCNAAEGGSGVSTAIGCIPTEPKAFVEGVLKFVTFAGGGIAFILMILASLELITAEGNAELLNKAREKFYSAFIGLLIIIFAVLLMQVIGVDILGLPGFKQ